MKNALWGHMVKEREKRIPAAAPWSRPTPNSDSHHILPPSSLEICGVVSVWTCLQTNTQTNQQTNGWEHNLSGRVNNISPEILYSSS